MDKYLYMVNPRIPLRLCGEVIRRSKNVELDKEEVKYALKHGPVYRKFDVQTMERVTLQNLDEVHVEKKGMKVEVKVEDVVVPVQDLSTQEEVVKVSEGETPVVDTIKEHDKTATEKLAEELFGEMRDATPEEQESTQQIIDKLSEEVEDDEVVVSDDTAEIENTEETSEDVEEKVQDQKQPQTNNYYRKKKRNR